MRKKVIINDFVGINSIVLSSYYFFTEREDGADGQFEVLHAPRNTDDGAAKCESKD